MPLLSNPTNHEKWPGVIAKDIQKHVHSLKSTVYQVKGQVNGQTVLPMPVGVERVFEVEKLLIDTNGEMCDLYFKSAVEGVMIKWAAQINEVLANDSSEKATSAANPIPSVGEKTKHVDVGKMHKTAQKLGMHNFGATRKWRKVDTCSNYYLQIKSVNFFQYYVMI